MLEGVDVYDGWLENADGGKHGDEGADEGRDVGSRFSDLVFSHRDFKFDEDFEYAAGLCNKNDVWDVERCNGCDPNKDDPSG